MEKDPDEYAPANNNANPLGDFDEDSAPDSPERVRESLEDWDQLKDAFSSEIEETIDKDDNPYRAPIICVLGHVDTGKTTMLDKLRSTRIQAAEAGGITQQMGATMFPRDLLVQKISQIKWEENALEVFIPGLMIIDTPGHASFSAMRGRGSSLCDMAILVIDIMHGLERQTIESIELLKTRKLPFVIALNKVDRLFQWQSEKDAPIVDSLKRQNDATMREYDQRLKLIIAELAEHGLTCEPYYRNRNFKKTVSIVPLSAMQGEGIPDLLCLLTQLPQKFLKPRLLKKETLECNVLEVRTQEGLGSSLSAILVNGRIRVGDTIVACGLDGPVVTRVRTLIAPQAMKEIRDTSENLNYSGMTREVRGVTGVKIFGRDMEKVVAGSPVLIPTKSQSIDVMKIIIMEDLDRLMKRVAKSTYGVVVHASTIGSMEALLDFLRESGVPVSRIHVGKVEKRHVYTAAYQSGHAEYRCILAFDVKVSSEAKKEAISKGIQIFQADIIYHLFDAFKAYTRQTGLNRDPVICPAILNIMQDYPMNNSNPIVVSCRVRGEIQMHAKLMVVNPVVYLGTISEIRRMDDGVPIVVAKDDEYVTITIRTPFKANSNQHPMIWKHFDPCEAIFPAIMETENPWTVNFPRGWPLQKDDNPVIERIMRVFPARRSELLLAHEMQQRYNQHDDYG